MSSDKGAAAVDASIWIMGGATAASLDPATKDAIDEALNQITHGLLGGMLGGAATSVLLELLGVRPVDSEQGPR